MYFEIQHGLFSTDSGLMEQMMDIIYLQHLRFQQQKVNLLIKG